MRESRKLGSESKDTNNRKLKPLYEYLEGSMEQFTEFSEFLASCFALENILFFVKAIKFRQIVLSKASEDGNTCDHVEIKVEDEEMLHNIYGLDFKYLEGLDERIDNGNDANSKEMIHNIAAGIYDKYISMDGEYAINISAENRVKLDAFFNDKDHGIKDYLNVFDESVVEVYGMLTSVYRFQFKSNARYEQ